MYTQLAIKVTNRLIDRRIVDEAQREVYEYSFEVLLSDIVYAAVLLATALVFQCGLATVVFLVGFLPLRQLTGGYHAGSYTRCHLLFWCNQLLMVGCFYLVPASWHKAGAYLLAAAACVLVFLLAPVEAENKPLTPKERKRFFLFSRVLAAALLLFVAAAGVFNLSFRYVFILAFGAASVGVSLAAEKCKRHLQERGERNA